MSTKPGQFDPDLVGFSQYCCVLSNQLTRLRTTHTARVSGGGHFLLSVGVYVRDSPLFDNGDWYNIRFFEMIGVESNTPLFAYF